MEKQFLQSYLVECGLIETCQIEEAFEEHLNTGKLLEEILVERGYIKQKTIDYLLANIVFYDQKYIYYQTDSNFQQQGLQSHKLSFPTWYISPNKIAGFLCMAIFSLIFFNLLEKRADRWLDLITQTQLTTHYFDFDSEGNFPSLYSTITLVFCSLLMTIIAILKKTINSRYAKSWWALSGVFLYLSIDENCSIHEVLIPLIRNAFHTKGLLYFPWIIFGFVFVIIFLISFRELIYNLPLKIRNLFLISGAIYIAGVLGLESIGGYLGDVIGFNTKAYWITSTVEELLEMFGILLFIYSLLIYIKSYLTELHCSFSFQKQSK